MVDRAIVTVRRWPDFAEEAGVADVRTAEIRPTSAPIYESSEAVREWLFFPISA